MASGATRTFGSEFAILKRKYIRSVRGEQQRGPYRMVKVCCGEVWQVHARVFRELATGGCYVRNGLVGKATRRNDTYPTICCSMAQ